MNDEDIAAACEAATDIIKNTKAQIELLFAVLPKERRRPVRLVFLKLDEACLWMREAAPIESRPAESSRRAA